VNDYARQVLDPGDQVVLLGQAAEALAARRSGAVAVELPTGAKARIYCRPVRGDGRFGGVVHVKLIESGSRPTAGAPAPSRMFLAGLVGSGPLWLRGCQQVDAAYAAGELLALEGEPGVGKLAVLRAVHQRRNPAGRFRVLDAAEAGGQDWQVGERAELLNGEGSLVIRHVDQLSTRRLHALPAALQEARAARRQQSPWVGARPALEGIRPGCCGSSRAPSSFPAPASHRGPARSCAVLPREAQPAPPAGLLSRGDAASAPVELAG